MKFATFKYYFLLTILFIGFEVNSQIIYKTLIIDTLITNEFDFHLFNTDTLTQSENFLNFNFKKENFEIDTLNFPNLIIDVKLINEKASIRLTIDSKGGFIELLNLYNLEEDTLYINKIEVFENCLYDTIYKRVDYWQVTDTGLLVPQKKIKFETEAISSNCKNDAVNKIYLLLNQKRYSCPLIKVEKNLVIYSHFHGYKPKKYLRKRDDYKRKNKIYFSGRTSKVQYIYIGKIDFKD